MSQGEVIMAARETLWVILKASMPLLIVSLIVGLIVSLFQTLTSIQEQTLTFVPKLLAIFLSLMLLGSWIANSIGDYVVQLWSNFSMYVR
ncbi:MAG: flagellar biosynthesis protein FliQ [Thermoflexaceae bacterium]|nr:flagellar biosynthesis protein FliQ [Thermoflexaceae bacterium]